jgi:hypothetical protein
VKPATSILAKPQHTGVTVQRLNRKFDTKIAIAFRFSLSLLLLGRFRVKLLEKVLVAVNRLVGF